MDERQLDPSRNLKVRISVNRLQGTHQVEATEHEFLIRGRELTISESWDQGVILFGPAIDKG